MDEKNPQVQAQNTTNATQPIVKPLGSKNNTSPLMVGLIVLVLVLIGATGFLAYQNMQLQKQISGAKNSQTTETSTLPSTGSNPMPNNSSNQKIVYEKESNAASGQISNSQIWTMDVDGTNATKLNITANSNSNPPVPLHNLSSGWVYYFNSQTRSTDSTIYAYNYLTNTTNQTSLLSQQDNLISVSNYSVSPDSNYIVYNVSYYLNKGQYAQPVDLYPTYKSGTYAYNPETNKSIYLGNLGYISGWSQDSKSIYTCFIAPENYHEYQLAKGCYSFDVTSGNSTSIGSITDDVFDYYGIYPINNETQLISENLKNSNGGQGNGAIKVVKNGQTTIIDSGIDVLPRFSVSPNGSFAIYTKANKVMLLDLSTLTTKVVYTPDSGKSINLPTWVSNSQIIIGTLDLNTNQNPNIVSVDITTGTSKALTISNDAGMF